MSDEEDLTFVRDFIVKNLLELIQSVKVNNGNQKSIVKMKIINLDGVKMWEYVKPLLHS